MLKSFQTLLGVQGKRPLLSQTKTWQLHKHSSRWSLLVRVRESRTAFTCCQPWLLWREQWGGSLLEDTRCMVLDHQEAVVSCRLDQSRSVMFRSRREGDKEEKRLVKPSNSYTLVFALEDSDATAQIFAVLQDGWPTARGAASTQHLQEITLCWVTLSPFHQESIA